MAATEARAVWQRTVNRCFVQEDAKRAPKLACCQSSSSASTKQLDSLSSGPPDLQDHSSTSFMPLNRSHRFSDLSPDTKWWPYMYANQKELMNDQIKPLEIDINIPENDQGSASCKKRNLSPGENEVKIFTSDDFQETKESYGIATGYESSKKFNDLGSPWNLSNEKAEPWWRTTDKDELASLVAQKSLDFIENCDLPIPQKLHKGSTDCFGCDGLSSLDRDAHITNPTIHGHGQKRTVHDQSSSDKSFRYLNSVAVSNSVQERGLISGLKNRSETESQVSSDSGLSKAELLEALHHSQTRAREAEKAAKEANAEKEHLVKLLFKQASQLFAYKQWFQLLQLEALYLQIKNDPSFVKRPWMHNETRKPRKRGKQNAEVTKYTVAFALGLSLVGAGLLLGWTVGWMLPF